MADENGVSAPSVETQENSGIETFSTTNPVEKIETPPTEPKQDDSAPQPAADDDSEGHEESSESKAKSRRERQKAKYESTVAENAALKAQLEALKQPKADSQQAKPDNGEPKEADFDNVIDYLKAHQKWVATDAANTALTEREAAAKQQADQARLAVKVDSHETREQDFANETPDYYNLVNPMVNSGVVTPQLAEAVMDYDESPQMAYHFAKFPGDLLQVRALEGPALKVALDTIRDYVKNQSAAVKKTSAAPPITPIKGSAGSNKNPEDMSQQDYEKWRGLA